MAWCPCIVHLGGSKGWEELREALKSRGTLAIPSVRCYGSYGSVKLFVLAEIQGLYLYLQSRLALVSSQ